MYSFAASFAQLCSALICPAVCRPGLRSYVAPCYLAAQIRVTHSCASLGFARRRVVGVSRVTFDKDYSDASSMYMYVCVCVCVCVCACICMCIYIYIYMY